MGPLPSKVLDLSVRDIDKYYFTYNSPVITFVKENYNIIGDYSRITIKRKSFILNPRVYLMVRLLFMDKVDLDKKAWDYLLLAVQLIFDKIKKIKFALKCKRGYLKRIKKTVLRIETVFNYEKSDKMFYYFFDSLFCAKINKTIFMKEKIGGRVLKGLCDELDKMKVLAPCFIDRVLNALEIVTEKCL
ncbi:hypothetical protein NBO_4g0072 [Nosema bombycis CQ1]|uniref:Uncharacterized protein n=1 Tax=Nosema bombycis (strain CQ1 / CVCC 102059) TaxID=578461 RepID=R0MBW9_NOSB1|nr:hypothetical protein NBO_4g0072 [Nosema bombycis CQ1]|eukprot:EOB15444.1 hypothetical protein NBO_4g0072 [Nosema bombycis CQ1]